MKLFLTTSLLLLLVHLALSNVIAKRSEKKIKIIYDDGYYRSESRDAGEFWFFTYANRGMPGSYELHVTAGQDAKGRKVELVLVHNDAKPSLDDLSFVMESVSPDPEECQVAPAFKNLVGNCTGSIRVRELTDAEKSKAQKRKQQLAASLEVKKRELKGTKSAESGEFRLLVDNESKKKIAESIGIHNYLLLKDTKDLSTYMHVSNIEADPGFHHEKQMGVDDVKASFAAENILRANTEKNCERSPLSKWINDCILAELRPLTEEEKSELESI